MNIKDTLKVAAAALTVGVFGAATSARAADVLTDANLTVTVTETDADGFGLMPHLFDPTDADLGNPATIVVPALGTTLHNSPDDMFSTYNTTGDDLIVADSFGERDGPLTFDYKITGLSGDKVTSTDPFVFKNGTLTFSDNGGFVTFAISAASPVPEPAAWGAMLLGVGMIGAGLRRRQAAPAPV